MSSTTQAAVNSFLSDTVNLDSDDTKTARASRDWLLTQIAGFGNDDSFPKLWSDYNLYYGSFARRTKIRPLDDVDLIVGLHGQHSTYLEEADAIRITIGATSNLKPYCNNGTQILNSTSVIRAFLNKFDGVYQYSSADTKKDGSAAVLNLKSYDWSFDVVPAYVTSADSNGRSYYLIPDGFGNWKKTDPEVDKNRVTALNTKHNGRVLDSIRMTKYWNRRPTMPSMEAYDLECLILTYCESLGENTTLNQNWAVNLCNIFYKIAELIDGELPDPKGIDGDLLSKYSVEEKEKIASKANSDGGLMSDAYYLEADGNHKEAIAKWASVFGDKFPDYD